MLLASQLQIYVHSRIPDYRVILKSICFRNNGLLIFGIFFIPRARPIRHQSKIRLSLPAVSLYLICIPLYSRWMNRLILGLPTLMKFDYCFVFTFSAGWSRLPGSSNLSRHSSRICCNFHKTHNYASQALSINFLYEPPLHLRDFDFDLI